MTFKILAFGSREWRDRALIRATFQRFPPGTILVHGAARGADRLAGEVGEELGFEVRDYPANWEAHGRGAGPIRNAEMLKKENPGSEGVLITKAYGFSTGPHNRGTLDMSRRLWDAKVRFEILFPTVG